MMLNSCNSEYTALASVPGKAVPDIFAYYSNDDSNATSSVSFYHSTYWSAYPSTSFYAAPHIRPRVCMLFHTSIHTFVHIHAFVCAIRYHIMLKCRLQWLADYNVGTGSVGVRPSEAPRATDLRYVVRVHH
jgi:hypothetical protein